MNLEFIKDDFRLNIRTSALIYNKDKRKVLLFNVEGNNFYMLPGGRMEMLEESKDAIKREIKEELGWNNLEFSFLAVSEEFVNAKGYNCEQINFIYETIYNDEITKEEFKGLDGDWINFKWIDISNIDEYKIFPVEIKDIILGKNDSKHFVNNLIKNKE